jgi:glycosyltransferase involved in cell wall biosynthesis
MKMLDYATRIGRTRTQTRALQTHDATVSVVITCYNYGRFLRHAVESAMRQDHVRVEVIVVDDASTDNSLDEARQLQREYPTLVLLAHEENLGTVATFNDGLRRATGEFVVRLDADDLLTSGSLARSVALMQTYPSVGLVYGHPLHFRGDVPAVTGGKPTAWTIWPGQLWLEDRCRYGTNVITSPEVLMRRSVLEQAGYQAPLRHTHDMEHWFRLAAFSDVAYIHGVDQALHREHPLSLSEREVDKFTDLLERLAAYETLCLNVAPFVPQASQLLDLARRSLVRQSLDFAAHDIESGKATPESVQAYMEFATRTDPSAHGYREWAVLQSRLSATSPNGIEKFKFLTARVRRRLKAEVRQRRWHRSGVYRSQFRRSWITNREIG